MASYRDLVVRFAGDAAALNTTTRQVQGQLNKTADTADTAGKKGGRRFGAGIAAGIGAAAKRVAGPLAAIFGAQQVGRFAVGTIKAASDVNETLNQSSAIFGKHADGMKTWASTAATSFGLSRQQALEAATGFGDMFLQLGFTGQEASKNSKSIVKMASDLGSFKNLETSDVLERISAAMRGEYDSLQAVIPNINAARVEKEALAATGKKNASALTAEEKAQATMNIIMKDGARAQGDFAKTSGGLANQQKILGAQWADLQAKLGTALLPVATAFFGFLTTTALPALTGLVSGGDGAGSAFDRISAVFATVKTALAPVVDGFRRIMVAVRPIVTALKNELFPAIRENMPAITGAVKDFGSILSSAFTLLGAYYSRIAGTLSKVWNVIGPTVTKIFGNTIRAVIQILAGAIKVIAGVLNVIVGIFTGDFGKIKKGVTQIFRGLVKIVGALLRLFIGNIRAVITPIVKWVIGRFAALGRGIRKAFSAVTKWVGSVWSKGWGKVKGWMSGAVEGGRNLIGKAWGKVKGAFNTAKNWTQKTWSKGWNAVKNWIGNPVDAGRKQVGKAKDKIQSGLNRMKDWGKKTWSKTWSGMKQVISDPVGSARKVIDSQQGRIRGVFNALDGWGKKIFGKRWDKIKNTFTKPITSVVKYFRGVFGPGGGGVRKIFSDGVAALGKIWDRVRGLMTTPLKFVVNTVINKGILGALRTVAGFVGMKDKVPSVNWGKMTGAARGAILPGSSSWRQGDDQLIGARRGEGVMVSEGLRDPASRRLFLGANAAARNRGTSLADYVHGHAQGGIVGKLSGGSGRFSPRATQTLLRAQQLAGVPFSIFQRGFRPTTSYSGTSHAGDAIDTGPVTSRVVAALRSAGWAAWDRTGKGNWVPHIHGVPLRGAGFAGGSGVWQAQDYLRGGDGLGGRDQGPRGMLDRVKGWLKGAGKAIGGIGGSIGGAMPDLSGMFKRLTGKAFKGWQQFAGSPFADIVKALPKKLISGGMDWVKEKAAALSPFGGGAGKNYGADKMGIAKTIVATARRLGFGDRGAIIGLITGIVESGLRNVNFGDRDSLGVFQQRAAWGPRSARLNPAKAAHMFYTGGQAGQEGLRDKPWRSMGMGAAAQAVQVSAHPGRYAERIGEAQSILARIKGPLNRDSGGRLPTGTSLVHNGTGRDEQIVTGNQWDAITNGTGKIEINIQVQGGIVDDRTADRIAEALERRMRRKGPTRITARSRP